MAKKLADDLKIAPKKLDLKATLQAFDYKNVNYYNNLSDEDKKLYSPLTLMRYMSSASDSNGNHELHVYLVNEVVNKNFWVLSKDHTELLHILLTMCGQEKPQFHQWIPNPKKKKSQTKLFEFFKKVSNDLNNDEYEIYLKNHSRDSFEALCKEFGLDDKEIKNLLKSFDEAKSHAIST